MSVPIGTIIDWWYFPHNKAGIPEGWQFCDGSSVEDKESPLFGEKLPDLRGRFTRCAKGTKDTTSYGGNETHLHNFNPLHHTHEWVQFLSLRKDWSTKTYDNGNLEFHTIIDWGNGIDTSGEGIYPIAVENPGNNSYSFFTSIGYPVSNAIDAGQVVKDSSDSEAQAGGRENIHEKTGEGNSLPPFATVLKLMKIR